MAAFRICYPSVLLCLLLSGLSLAEAKESKAKANDEGSVYTMVGTPDFVATLTSAAGQKEGKDRVNLCYQVTGKAGKIFNLLYSTCVAVNAEYASSVGTQEQVESVVTKVGILVQLKGKQRDCRIAVDHTNNCILTVNDEVVEDTYHHGDISIKKNRNHVAMTLPSCHGNLISMSAICTKVVSTKAVKLSLTSHSDVEKYHGLIGQFWNIHTTLKKHHHDTISGLYAVTVSPPNSPTRTFLGELYSSQWDGRQHPCLYAGSADGGTNNFGTEFEQGSSVIEGLYTDYEVSSLFQTDFKFATLRTEPNVISVPPVTDAIVAGSLYSVVVQTAPKTLSLCYEISGEPDTVYSLVSHDCVAVNAHYVAAKFGKQDLKVIDRIGLTSKAGDIIRKVAVDATNCSMSVDGHVQDTFDNAVDEFSMRKNRALMEFILPTCGEAGFILWVECANGPPPTQAAYLKIFIDRTIAPPTPAKGLIGQFWGQTISYKEDFSTKTDNLFANKRKNTNTQVTLIDWSSETFKRSFPSELVAWRWDGEMATCLYSGNTEGGTSEVGGDSVIQGRLEDYVREDIFDL
jgi:hypothetical protein